MSNNKPRLESLQRIEIGKSHGGIERSMEWVREEAVRLMAINFSPGILRHSAQQNSQDFKLWHRRGKILSTFLSLSESRYIVGRAVGSYKSFSNIVW
jgi:hypothetical protein